jgi:hypothetical protein
VGREIEIATQDGGKGRTFRAVCLATVEADTLWEGGLTDTEDMRPVWASFVSSEAQLKPFAVNLLSGRKANFVKDTNGYQRRKDEKLNVLRSAGYQSVWQRELEGSSLTLFLPDLFQMDPGMVDPKGAAFVVMPTQEWANSQQIEVGPIARHVYKLLPDGLKTGDDAISMETLASLVPMAFLFCTYLDRRTRCPLVSDGRFYLQLLISCLGDGLASWPNGNAHAYYTQPFGLHNKGFYSYGVEEVGLVKPIAFKASHTDIETMLARQVALFFETTRGR